MTIRAFRAFKGGRKRGAGRPALENVERYPNGQIKHQERERDVKAVVIAARVRQHELPEEVARSDLAGSVLGRIYLDGKLGNIRDNATKGKAKARYEVGQAYCNDVLRYYAYYLNTPATATAQDLLRVRGFDGEASKRQHDLGIKAFERMTRIDVELLKDGPGAKTTIFNVCVKEEPAMRKMPEKQMALLRKSLDRLIWFYGIGDANG